MHIVIEKKQKEVFDPEKHPLDRESPMTDRRITCICIVKFTYFQ